MNKRFLITVFAFILVCGLRAQSSLGMDTTTGSTVYISPTTFGSNDPLMTIVRNFGPQAYSGIVNVEYYVDSTGGNNLLQFIQKDSASVTLPVNGGFQDSTGLFIQASGSYAFRSGINTVVIWPRASMSSNPFTTKDTLFLSIWVDNTGMDKRDVTFNSRIFPNPARQRVAYVNADPSFIVERVRISDWNGKPVSDEKFTGTIDLGALPCGIYHVEFISSSGKTARYKLIKE